MHPKIQNAMIPVNNKPGINNMIVESKEQVSNLMQGLEALTSEQIKNAVETANEMGTPFFTMDTLEDTVHPLAQLLRYLFVSNNITKEKFDALHEQLALQTCMSGNHKNSEKNNTKRAMVNPEVTWNTFEKVLNICGYELTDINITLKNRATGVVTELSRNEVAATVNKHTSSKSKHEFTRVTI